MGRGGPARLSASPPVWRGGRGGAAIQAHVEAADGPAVRWFHPGPSKKFTGPGPLQAVSLHRLGEPDHWHLVTYGLTEPPADGSPDRDRSGWGFELTFRVAAAGSDEPPLWAVEFLASLAAYVWSDRHPFAAGHIIDLRGPVRSGGSSALTAAVVVADPQLGALATPIGPVEFLQVVGLTADELELCRAWSAAGVVEMLSRSGNRLLVTDMDRGAILDDPQVADEIRDRARREGSELHELHVGSLRVRRRRRLGRVDVQMGAGAAAALGPALRRELLADGAAFCVVGDDRGLRFAVGPEPGWRVTDDGVEATITEDGVEYVAALFDGRTGWGRVSDWPGLRFRVVS